jgi:hypothetical protein
MKYLSELKPAETTSKPEFFSVCDDISLLRNGWCLPTSQNHFLSLSSDRIWSPFWLKDETTSALWPVNRPQRSGEFLMIISFIPACGQNLVVGRRVGDLDPI